MFIILACQYKTDMPILKQTNALINTTIILITKFHSLKPKMPEAN